MTLREYYINRNFKIIKDFRLLQSKGVTARRATQQVATMYKVSFALVNAVMYDKAYAFSKEAHSRYKKYEDGKKAN